MGEKRHAILIGSSEYPSSGGALPPLPSALDDVGAMQKVLSDPEFGHFTDVQALLDLPHYEVLLRVNQVIRKADRDDLLLIYYSGHGQLDRSGSLYFAMVDTDPQLLHATAVPSSTLRSLVRECRARRIVLVLDCCYSGAIGGIEPASVESNLTGIGQEITDGYTIFIMAASGAGQQGYTRNGDANGLLTKHILSAIRTGEADADGDGFITMHELYDYVCERVANESVQQPTCFSVGPPGPLVIARTPNGDGGPQLITRIRQHLSEAPRTRPIPAFVVARMREILGKPVDEIHRNHASLFGLMRDWVRYAIPTKDLVDQWYQLDKTGLPESERSEPQVSRERRWEKVSQCRRPILDQIGPSYLLDNTYHFLDWNPMFDQLVAQPMGLVRGRHAEDFILKLHNRGKVIERSRRAFREREIPLVDIEPLEFKSPRYGMIRFQKIAAQIPDSQGRILAWSVNLNILGAEREEEMWRDLGARLTAEVNWANYAKAYDQMLLKFGAYRKLLGDVTSMVGDATRVADLAAGTGNGTIALLNGSPERSIWAFEANEAMLDYMREKLEDLPDRDRERVCIFKGDLLVSLREFEERTFDGVVIINGLYALDDPGRCMREINRVLRPGGVVALSTPTRKTDLDGLFTAIRADLEEQGILDDLLPIVDSAYDRNVQMKARIHRDTRDDVLTYVRSAGFKVSDAEDVIDNAYEGAVMVVRAVKPELVVPAMDARPLGRPNDPETDAAPDRHGALAARNGPKKVFISYAREDEEWCQRLQKYLAPAVQSELLEIWDDQRIQLGDAWEQTIEENLSRSSAAVLLVSPAFLGSDFIRNKELPLLLTKAKSDGILILPIWIEQALVRFAVYKYPDPVRGPHKFCLTDLQGAGSPDEPIASLDRSGQNLTLDKIAHRLIGAAGADSF